MQGISTIQWWSKQKRWHAHMPMCKSCWILCAAFLAQLHRVLRKALLGLPSLAPYISRSKLRILIILCQSCPDHCHVYGHTFSAKQPIHHYTRYIMVIMSYIALLPWSGKCMHVYVCSCVCVYALHKMLHMKHACYMQKARDDMQHACWYSTIHACCM